MRPLLGCARRVRGVPMWFVVRPFLSRLRSVRPSSGPRCSAPWGCLLPEVLSGACTGRECVHELGGETRAATLRSGCVLLLLEARPPVLRHCSLSSPLPLSTFPLSLSLFLLVGCSLPLVSSLAPHSSRPCSLHAVRATWLPPLPLSLWRRRRDPR
jgi:hypothetical protein